MGVSKEELSGILPDWDIYQCGDSSFEASSHSPAGENVVVPIQGETLWDMANFVDQYYDGFDAEDHAAQIYHAKHYGDENDRRFYAAAPDGLEHLLADAKAIDAMYWEMAAALRSAANRECDDEPRDEFGEHVNSVEAEVS